MLLGFADMKATQQLRLLSGWQDYTAHLPPGWERDHARDVSIGDLPVWDKLRHDVCHDSPCFIFGATDQGTIYWFLKLERY